MEAQLKLNLTRQVHAEDGNSMVPYSFRAPGALGPLFEMVVSRMNKKDRGTLIAQDSTHFAGRKIRIGMEDTY
jgi:hypothetical protein